MCKNVVLRDTLPLRVHDPEVVVAAGLAMSVLWGVQRYATRFVGPLIFYDAAQISGFVVLCAIVSAFGSLTSLRRFLRI